MKKLRIATIGLGFIGLQHLENMLAHPRIEITGICDTRPGVLNKYSEKHRIQGFLDYQELLDQKIADAVVISTPHYSHTTIGIAALKAGYHVLVEKPISVHKADCERLLRAHQSNRVFAAMFNQRTDPRYRRIKRIIETGELGELTRMQWTITDWFRTDAYYKGGGWRATWKGEGGGVLLNQSPHQLDMLIWLCGMPAKVRAFAHLGKTHQIEVEDEVTAYLEFANGASGVFITSTGEAPGTNRLEICGERGRIVVEGNQTEFLRNEITSSEFRQISTDPMGKPEIWPIAFKDEDEGGQHREILNNFVEAVLEGTPLIAPANEGIHSVELANAMLYSALKDEMVQFPLDGIKYETLLKELQQ